MPPFYDNVYFSQHSGTKLNETKWLGKYDSSSGCDNAPLVVVLIILTNVVRLKVIIHKLVVIHIQLVSIRNNYIIGFSSVYSD